MLIRDNKTCARYSLASKRYCLFFHNQGPTVAVVAAVTLGIE